MDKRQEVNPGTYLIGRPSFRLFVEEKEARMLWKSAFIYVDQGLVWPRLGSSSVRI